MLSRLLAWYRSTLGQAVLGAVLLWAALPPLELWPLAWFAPIAWVLLVRRAELPGRRPYAALWLAGFAFWMAAIHWLVLPHWATSFGLLALAFYLAFYLPVFVGLSRVAVHGLRVPVVLAAPTIWTGLELARAHLLTGFTMASLGHTQYRWIEVIQISDLAGAYGVSFLVMFVAACLARMVPLRANLKANAAAQCGPVILGQQAVLGPARSEGRPAFWPLVPLLLGLGAALAYGVWRIDVPPAEPRACVGLIQGSIDVELQHDPDPERRDFTFNHYLDLSRQALAEASRRGLHLDLIVWPETMFNEPQVTSDDDPPTPGDWPYSRERFLDWISLWKVEGPRALRRLTQTLGVPVLLGLDTFYFGGEGRKVFNSAVYVARGGEVLGRYDKMHLVMFGEYVPFARRFPWLQRLTPLPSSADAGQRPEAFTLGTLRLAPSICYETVLPHVIAGQVRALAAEGREPDVLVNLTNDGWFWGSSELDLHLICGVFRAVECRKPLVIAANTGFSAWIDGDGRRRAQGPRRAPAVLFAELAPDSRRSLYLRWGDWPAGVCLGVCLVMAAVGVCQRMRRRTARPL